MLVRLDSLNSQTLTDELRRLLRDYLFGQTAPRFEARGSLHDF